MAEGIKILYNGGVGELEEKKSRFIATTLPIASQEEALAFIEKTKKYPLEYKLLGALIAWIIYETITQAIFYHDYIY